MVIIIIVVVLITSINYYLHEKLEEILYNFKTLETITYFRLIDDSDCHLAEGFSTEN